MALRRHSRAIFATQAKALNRRFASKCFSSVTIPSPIQVSWWTWAMIAFPGNLPAQSRSPALSIVGQLPPTTPHSTVRRMCRWSIERRFIKKRSMVAGPCRKLTQQPRWIQKAATFFARLTGIRVHLGINFRSITSNVETSKRKVVRVNPHDPRNRIAADPSTGS